MNMSVAGTSIAQSVTPRLAFSDVVLAAARYIASCSSLKNRTVEIAR